MAPRVQGKILETETGTRFIVIEQKGKDIWRGRHKSLTDAVEAGVAGLGVDRILVQRAIKHDVKIVLVVIEELRKIFLTPIEDFANDELCISRANYQGRSTRILNWSRWHQKYLGPTLTTRSKRVSA